MSKFYRLRTKKKKDLVLEDFIYSFKFIIYKSVSYTVLTDYWLAKSVNKPPATIAALN